MSKKEIRKLVKQLLSKSSDLTLQSEFLVSLVQKREEWKVANVVAMYLPLKDEPNIDELILQGQRFWAQLSFSSFALITFQGIAPEEKVACN